MGNSCTLRFEEYFGDLVDETIKQYVDHFKKQVENGVGIKPDTFNSLCGLKKIKKYLDQSTFRACNTIKSAIARECGLSFMLIATKMNGGQSKVCIEARSSDHPTYGSALFTINDCDGFYVTFDSIIYLGKQPVEGKILKIDLWHDEGNYVEAIPIKKVFSGEEFGYVDEYWHAMIDGSLCMMTWKKRD